MSKIDAESGLEKFALSTPVFPMTAIFVDSALWQLNWDEDFGTKPVADAPPAHPVHRLAEAVQRYFEDGSVPFLSQGIEIKSSGTPFQEKVWAALREIPPGQVMTYGELAEKLDSAPRAVGNACRENPLVVMVPCHRAVGKGNQLTGYGGKTMGQAIELKRWLLQHEGVVGF